MFNDEMQANNLLSELMVGTSEFFVSYPINRRFRIKIASNYQFMHFVTSSPTVLLLQSLSMTLEVKKLNSLRNTVSLLVQQVVG